MNIYPHVHICIHAVLPDPLAEEIAQLRAARDGHAEAASLAEERAAAQQAATQALTSEVNELKGTAQALEEKVQGLNETIQQLNEELGDLRMYKQNHLEKQERDVMSDVGADGKSAEDKSVDDVSEGSTCWCARVYMRFCVLFRRDPKRSGHG